MEIVNKKQIWKGFFNYQEDFEDIEQYIEVTFTMELNFNEDSFIGTTTDSESENIFDKPATVKGFIDRNKMSFVINYPCLYYKDENGKIVLDKKTKHPEIRYLGYYDEDYKVISGTWEMTLYEEKNLEDYLEAFAEGQFQMRRVQ